MLEFLKKSLPTLEEGFNLNSWHVMPVERDAYFFANAAHAAIDQRRKYTNEPYIIHPVMVYNIVRAIGGSSAQKAAALLHDVVEDTAVSIETIKVLFGDEIAYLVSDLTDISKPEDGIREVRKAIDREHTQYISNAAKTIKLADLISNTCSIVECDPNFAVVYLKEKAKLLEVLGGGDSQLLSIAKEMVSKAQMDLALRPR